MGEVFSAGSAGAVPPAVAELLRAEFPGLLERCRKILFDPTIRNDWFLSPGCSIMLLANPWSIPMVGFRSTIFAVVAGCLLLLGCQKQEQPTADPEPFKQAVAAYLQASNMGMKLKEIKVGPAVSGNEATLTASLVHAEMGGPAVTWQFTFRKAAEGGWKVDSVQR